MKTKQLPLFLTVLALAAALTAAAVLPAMGAETPLLIAPAPTVVRPTEQYGITVNGEALNAGAVLMVPARKVGEALGFTVTWLGNGQFTLDDGVMHTTDGGAQIS